MNSIFKSRFNPLMKLMVIAITGILPLTTRAMGDDGITVTGTATAKARPTEVDITGTVSGEGELANDANVKYHDSKKKAVAAIDNMKNPDVSIESKGSDIHEAVDPAQQQRMMQGMAAEPLKTRVQISEKLTLKLKNIDKMDPDKVLAAVLKLIDTGHDAGIAVGSAGPMNYYQMQMQMQNGGGDESLVVFKIPDTADLQGQAYKQAIADARTKAERIAQLSGVKLGRVISVHDEGETSSNRRMNMNGNENVTISNEATSPTFGDIPLTVKVQVQFEIEK